MKPFDFLPRRKSLNWILVSLFLLSLPVMVFSRADGKQLAFDLSVGIMVSLLIYFLVVFLPEHQKRSQVRRNLSEHYDLFKEACIYNFFFAMNEAADPEVVRQLKDRKFFRWHRIRPPIPWIRRVSRARRGSPIPHFRFRHSHGGTDKTGKEQGCQQRMTQKYGRSPQT